MSHGLGGAAGAAAGALVGKSAANAGTAAAETASAATTDNTTFFIETAPFNSIGRRFWPIPFCSPYAWVRKNPPGFRPRPSAFDLHCGKFRPVAACRGKRKTAAIAAFLGEFRSFRQKDAACCFNATKSSCTASPNDSPGGSHAPRDPSFPHLSGYRQLILQRRRV